MEPYLYGLLGCFVGLVVYFVIKLRFKSDEKLDGNVEKEDQ
ncbi:MAG: hypothetical protein N2450_06440 [bacterium]|nr:hypothetical protein [bacterium]